MQCLQPTGVLRAALIATTLMLGLPAMADENKFVFVPQSDSPGNDYLRMENSSFSDCAQRCNAQSQCNAFTYNQLHRVCSLKLAANRATTFYALAITGVKLSPSVQPIGGAPRGGSSFVMLSQADSPGNDYSRIDNFDMEECRRSCETDDGCNAFTYNLAKGVCFLKRAANQWTSFYAWAITGIKLSSPPKEKTAAPLSPQATPSEKVQTPQHTAPKQPAPTESNASSSAATEVPLIEEAGNFRIPVLINGVIELHFVLDSGAADVVIPADVVITLMRTGTLTESDFMGSKIYVLADGSTFPSQTFRIRTLKVGNRIIENVVGSIGDVGGDLLLGQSFLSKLNYWSFDNGRHVLMLN
jgi:aspartyl protease family protein